MARSAPVTEEGEAGIVRLGAVQLRERRDAAAHVEQRALLEGQWCMNATGLSFLETGWDGGATERPRPVVPKYGTTRTGPRLSCFIYRHALPANSPGSFRLVFLTGSRMAIETTFFRDLAYVFGAAVVGGSVAKLLRQPLILGYVLGGFLIGPFTPGPNPVRGPPVRSAGRNWRHPADVLDRPGIFLQRASAGEVGGHLRGAAGDPALDWDGRGRGTVDGLEPAPGNRDGCNRFRRQHHGALPPAGGPRRITLVPRPRDDRHHAGGGPRRRSSDRPASFADQSHGKPFSFARDRGGQGPADY